jgi:pimeloyl-ACP methyl ester carboxylesterase
MKPADPTDILVTLVAEDGFDVEESLPRVTAPTLVIGGGGDIFYSAELFRRTAAGVRDGRVHIFPGWGHARASGGAATTHLALGFMLAGVPAGAGR